MFQREGGDFLMLHACIYSCHGFALLLWGERFRWSRPKMIVDSIKGIACVSSTQMRCVECGMYDTSFLISGPRPFSVFCC